MHIETQHFSVRKTWILIFPDKIKAKQNTGKTNVHK